MEIGRPSSKLCLLSGLQNNETHPLLQKSELITGGEVPWLPAIAGKLGLPSLESLPCALLLHTRA